MSWYKKTKQNLPIDVCNAFTSFATTNFSAGTTVPWYNEEGATSSGFGGGEGAGFVALPARPRGARFDAFVAGG